MNLFKRTLRNRDIIILFYIFIASALVHGVSKELTEG